MSSIAGLNPPDMGTLNRLQRVSFSILDGAGVSIALVWVRFDGSDDEELVWDGTQFSYPYDSNSTLVRPLGDDTNLHFDIIPEGGWIANISELRVEAVPAIV